MRGAFEGAEDEERGDARAVVQRQLRDFHGYLRMIQDVLIAGRGLRGRAARRTRAAIGHALAFPTWRSLTYEQRLADDDAVALMCALVEGSARAGSRISEP